jgi:hypothetical protein
VLDGQKQVRAALDRHGIRAAMTVEGATDGPLFLTFLRRVLCPQALLEQESEQHEVEDDVRQHLQKVKGVPVHSLK